MVESNPSDRASRETSSTLQQACQQALQSLPSIRAYGRLVSLETEDYHLQPGEIQQAIQALSNLEGRQRLEAIEMVAQFEQVSDQQLAELLEQGTPLLAQGTGAARLAQIVLSHPQAGNAVAQKFADLLLRENLKGLDKLFVGFLEEDRQLVDRLMNNDQLRRQLAGSSHPLVLERVLAYAQQSDVQRQAFQQLQQHRPKLAERLMYRNWAHWKDWLEEEQLQQLRQSDHEALRHQVGRELRQRR